jgi:hypothetical protein
MSNSSKYINSGYDSIKDMNYVYVEGTCDDTLVTDDLRDYGIKPDNIVTTMYIQSGEAPRRRCYEDGTWGPVENRCILFRICRTFGLTVQNMADIIFAYDKFYDSNRNNSRANYPLKDSITDSKFEEWFANYIKSSEVKNNPSDPIASFAVNAKGIDDVLKFSGTGEQLVDLGNMSYRRITIDKTEGSINFTNGFSADHFIARTTTPLSLFFAEGSVVDVDHLVLYGLAGESGAYNNLLTIGSTGTWYLKATDCHHIRGVNLSNCNASKGQKVKLGVFSNNVSGNDLESCDFSESATSEWIGGGSDFDSSSSWANGIVPSDNTQICICPPKGVSYTLSTSRELSTGAIIIGGEGGTVSFTSNYKNAIEGGCYILSGATASFGFYAQPNTVAGDFMLGRNATLTHNVTDSGSLEKYKLNFLVSGNATIEQGGIVNIENKGFGGKSSGPGRAISIAEINGKATPIGSAYAGMGGHYLNKPYGSILHPFSLGSAGYDTDDAFGGGAIKLFAS